MRRFNSSPTVREIRNDAYGPEYVELKPSQSVMAIPCPEGAELHNDDGTISRVDPGGWVIEGPNGLLVAATSDVVAEYYDGKGDAYQASKESFDNKQKDAKDAEVDVTPIPFAGEERSSVTSAAVEHEVAGFESPEDMEFAERRKAGLDFQRLAEEAASRLREIVAKAVSDDLIDSTAGAQWIETGVAPEGVVIENTESGAIIIRNEEPSTSDIEEPGDEKIDVQGQDHEDLDELTIPELKKRAKKLKVEVGGNKAELIGRIRNAG